MLGLCELTGCRRQALLRYFGDELNEPCGNCDTCLEPPETWDATTTAQKALSCVHRTGQRFGVSYLVDVLLGKDNERIKSFGHDEVSTFGIGDELNQNEWRDLYQQLIARGLLAVDIEGFGSLKLTEEARPILRGELSLQLRKLSRKSKAKKRERKTSRYANTDNNDLWEALRTRRQQLADEQGIPAYMIFHDATLSEMMENRPENLSQMSNISGVGKRKLDDYGEQFLDVLNEYKDRDKSSQSDTEEQTLQLFRHGMDAEAIATERGLKSTTIYNHLANGIERDEIELAKVVPLAHKQLEIIRFTIEQHDGGKRLKPVFDALEGEYSYEILRCVRSDMVRSY